jgi:hypothetical protein
VGLGAITKVWAKQAITDNVKDVVQSLRPPDLAAVAENLTAAKAPSPSVDTAVGSILIGQIQAMQNALKDDQELVVLCSTGLETLRILEIFVPAWRVAVLTGIDSEKTVTRIISPIESLQLVCKPMNVEPESKPVRIRFVTPKP